jgi:hypothetical protein
MGAAALFSGATACGSPYRGTAPAAAGVVTVPSGGGPAFRTGQSAGSLAPAIRRSALGPAAGRARPPAASVPPIAPSVPPTTLPVPPLPAPAAIPALATPALPAEGVWQPVPGTRLTRGYAVYTTGLRPAPGYPAAGLAWIDTAATRLALYAGTGEPYGAWPQQGAVAAPLTPGLLAAFNAGFKIYSYGTGWYEGGRSATPLQAGAASLVIFTDGRSTVGEWGRDVSLGPTVAAVRQNLTLLVDHGQPAPTINDPGQWGAVLGGGAYTWRSGVGVTSGGDLVYAGGPDLDPALLAGLLIDAGCARAMELDINPEWVSFATFAHAGGMAGGGLVGATNLVAGMYFAPGHYLQPFSRDFFAVFAGD